MLFFVSVQSNGHQEQIKCMPCLYNLYFFLTFAMREELQDSSLQPRIIKPEYYT